MPRGRGKPPKSVEPGMTYGTWVVIREVERKKYNRRVECRCNGCGSTTVKWLSNLLQGKHTCLTCTPWSEVLRPGREAVIADRRARSLISDAGRICQTCGEWKAWSEFTRDKRRDTQKASNCMACARWNTIKSLYRITREEWEWLLASQDSLCALCGEEDSRRLAIDHDHSCCKPGRACKKCIRGMLCSACNRMLGLVEARPALVPRFADYLTLRPFVSAAGAAESVLEDVGGTEQVA